MTGNIRGGFIAVPRAIFTDTNFASEPFTELQAFLNLVADAGWQPRRVRLARGAVDLERGQLLSSTRFLAERWQWPEPRVRRFLNRISGRRANDAQTASQNDAENKPHADALIDAQPTRDGTIITILNYDVFQKVAIPSDNPIDAQSDAQNETQSDAKPDAPPDPKSTQREEIINNNTSVPSERALAAPCGSNVVSLISRSEVETDIPATPAGVLFGQCRKYLETAGGVPTRQARKIVGAWRKHFTDGEIIDAVSRAQREEAQDPVAFVVGCLKQKHRGDNSVGAMSAISALERYR
jgi:hypothetical protein